MSSPARLVTAEELVNHPDTERYELVRGRLRVSEPPGGLHGRIAMKLGSRLDELVTRLRLGTILWRRIRSPVEQKVADYMRAGARRDILDGENVVPGFTLDLAELFGPR